MSAVAWHFEALRQPISKGKKQSMDTAVKAELYRRRCRSALEHWQSSSCDAGVDAAAAVYHLYAKACKGNALYLVVAGDYVSCVWWCDERLKIAGHLSWQQSRELFQRLLKHPQLVTGMVVVVGLTHDTMSEFVETQLANLTLSPSQSILRLTVPPKTLWRHRLSRWRRWHLYLILVVIGVTALSTFGLVETTPMPSPAQSLSSADIQSSAHKIISSSHFGDIILALIAARERGEHDQPIVFSDGHWHSVWRPVAAEATGVQRLSETRINQQQHWLAQQLSAWLPAAHYQMQNELVIRLAKAHWHWTELERLRELIQPLPVDVSHINLTPTTWGWRGELDLRWQHADIEEGAL